MFSRRCINRRVGVKQSLILAAVATLVLTPAITAGANAAYDFIEENGAGSINLIVQSKSLAGSVSVLAEDAAIATQSLVDEAHPNRSAVKEITSDTEFSQSTLTRAGDPDIASLVRAERVDGSRSDWFSVNPDYPAEGNGNGLSETEFTYIEPTKRVQVSAHGPDIFGSGSGVDLRDIKGTEKLDLSKLNLDETNVGSAKEAVEDAKDPVTDVAKDVAEAVFDYQQIPDAASGDALDDSTAPSVNDVANPDSLNLSVKWTDIEPVADEPPIDQVDVVLIDGQVAASGIDPIMDAKNVTGMPKVITRASWGVNENNRCKGTDYDSKFVGATVHHTAGPNNYIESQSAGAVRGIYQYHAQTLGWCDTGCNALVDRYGSTYEGRCGGLDKNAQGAHVGGFNTGTFDIFMTGNYLSVAPSEAAPNLVGNMTGWRLKAVGIKSTGQIQTTSGGTSYSKYGHGKQVTPLIISAHRNVGNATCPGDAGYAQMSKIRSIAEKRYNTLTSEKINNEGPDGLIDLLVSQGEEDDKTTEDIDLQSTESTTSSFTTSTTPVPTGTPTTSSSEESLSASSTTSSTTLSSDSIIPGTSNTSEPTDAMNTSDTATADSPAPSASEQSNPSSPSAPDEQQKVQTPETVSGVRSMLASALGIPDTPGLGQTADAILGATGRSTRNGPSIVDLPVLTDQTIIINEQSDLAAEWRQVSEEMDSVLGYAISDTWSGSTVANNVDQVDALRYVKFSNDVTTDSDTTGAHVTWGKIADERARQGFEVGKLGAPTKTRVVDGDIERAEFQNDLVTFNHTTDEVKTKLK